jgi:hypothetical protein
MNRMFPVFARCEEDWASYFIAQQYGQNWRKGDKPRKHRKQRGVDDDGEDDDVEDEEGEDEDEDEDDEDDDSE